MINTKTKGELGRRIEYDVEHNLFHPQNIYSDEYITPTFVEYVKQLERKLEQTEKDLADYQFNYPTIKELQKENAELKSLKDVADLIRLNNSHIVAMAQLNNNNVALRKENAELEARCNELFLQTMQLTNAKELLNEFMRISKANDEDFEHDYSELIGEAEQFLSEVEEC